MWDREQMVVNIFVGEAAQRDGFGEIERADARAPQFLNISPAFEIFSKVAREGSDVRAG